MNIPGDHQVSSVNFEKDTIGRVERKVGVGGLVGLVGGGDLDLGRLGIDRLGRHVILVLLLGVFGTNDGHHSRKGGGREG